MKKLGFAGTYICCGISIILLIFIFYNFGEAKTLQKQDARLTAVRDHFTKNDISGDTSFKILLTEKRKYQEEALDSIDDVLAFNDYKKNLDKRRSAYFLVLSFVLAGGLVLWIISRSINSRI